MPSRTASGPLRSRPSAECKFAQTGCQAPLIILLARHVIVISSSLLQNTFADQRACAGCVSGNATQLISLCTGQDARFDSVLVIHCLRCAAPSSLRPAPCVFALCCQNCHHPRLPVPPYLTLAHASSRLFRNQAPPCGASADQSSFPASSVPCPPPTSHRTLKQGSKTPFLFTCHCTTARGFPARRRHLSLNHPSRLHSLQTPPAPRRTRS